MSLRWGAVAGAVWALTVACSKHEARDHQPQRALGVKNSALSGEPIQPLEAAPITNPALTDLGARLFHDPVLSKDGTLSCASCHDLEKGGADGLPRSIGIAGQRGKINAPTVFNAALNIAQFWDGRANTLEEQVDGPVQDPSEMGADWSVVEQKLGADASYVKAFQDALGVKPSREGVKQAIAAFERTLITVGSPFDRWLEGDQGALSAQQVEGYELFKGFGCVACHQGQNVGGNMYQRFGVFGDYFADRGNTTEADYGRFNVTGLEGDRFVFKVPSLRNVALTAPYFHDGSAKTLPEAVGIMAKYQLGREISDEQVEDLVAFLTSLSGPSTQGLAKSTKGEK